MDIPPGFPHRCWHSQKASIDVWKAGIEPGATIFQPCQLKQTMDLPRSEAIIKKRVRCNNLKKTTLGIIWRTFFLFPIP